MEEERARRLEEMMRTLVATLVEREFRVHRTKLGIDSLKLTNYQVTLRCSLQPLRDRWKLTVDRENTASVCSS